MKTIEEIGNDTANKMYQNKGFITDIEELEKWEYTKQVAVEAINMALRWIPVPESTPPKNIQIEIKTDGKYISTTEFQCRNVLDRCTKIHATHWRHIL